MITKEQEEEFKQRKSAGSKLSPEEIEEFNGSRQQFDKKQYLKFLKSTDEKCK